jgi:hypothetical protein
MLGRAQASTGRAKHGLTSVYKNKITVHVALRGQRYFSALIKGQKMSRPRTHEKKDVPARAAVRR